MKIELDYEQWAAAQYLLGYATASSELILMAANHETDFNYFSKEAIRIAESLGEKCDRAHRAMYPQMHTEEVQDDRLESATGV